MSPGGRPRHGIFILLRRLRMPLAALVLVYAVAVLGFTLVPGTDPQGRPWTMSFLHAFYFVSFLGTTIGLGEIPYPFSDPQRLWATASIYGTVIAWLYAIGALFSVLQDPLFRRIVHESGVAREVRRLREPFYLVCGYDDAGSRVARELAEDGVGVNVVDVEPTRVDAIDVEDLPISVPGLRGDASDPKTLLMAGLTHPQCAGVLALTGDDAINTKIALTARLLSPELPVLCAARGHAFHARMAGAGADQIINPFDTFAERVAMAIRTPSLHVIYESLTTQLGTAMEEVPQVPRGRWLLCGFGLFSRTLRRQLERLEIEPRWSSTPSPATGCDDSNSLRGDPTDPAVLRRAGIEDASALVAGTAVDIDNLAISLAARSLNKRIFIVARQTQRRNGTVFRACAGRPGDAERLCRRRGGAAHHPRAAARDLPAPRARRGRSLGGGTAGADARGGRRRGGRVVVDRPARPSWRPPSRAALARGETVTVRRLMTRPDGSDETARAVPLLLQRGPRAHAAA